MELQLGKQKRMMYARVFDRTEEETCSVDAVSKVSTTGHICPCGR